MDEGEIRLSQRQVHRLHVVRLTLERRETVGEAAEALKLSGRQVRRLRRKVEREGARGLVHGNRDKRAWNRTSERVEEKVVRLAREKYQGFNDTHLTEKLVEREGVNLSRATVRVILRRARIAAVRRHQPRRHYKRRERRAQEGALLLWDGSPHRWVGEDGPEWTLVGVMDDATGAFLFGVFVEQEDAQSYLTILRQVLAEKGIPVSVYMDRHGIFRRNDRYWTVAEELAGEQTPTQVGGALKALGTEPIFALSPQAKGRVERLWGTFQDRLVSELRLAGIRDREGATAFLNGRFKADFNRRFAKPPKETQAAWRPLPPALDVDRVCSFRYDAVVGNDNAVRLGGIILDIPPGPNRRGYAKARVEVRQLLDGRWRIYHQEQLLVETEKPVDPRPLRTLHRNRRESQAGERTPTLTTSEKGGTLSPPPPKRNAVIASERPTSGGECTGNGKTGEKALPTFRRHRTPKSPPTRGPSSPKPRTGEDIFAQQQRGHFA